MPCCSVCGRELQREHLIGCSECGKPYCKECANKDTSMKALGVCSDCEETWQAEDDLDEE